MPVIELRPTAQTVDGDGGGEPPDNRGMDHAERITSLEAVIPTLATKTDLLATKTDLQAEIGGLRVEMHKGFADQVKWIVGTAIALGAAGITVMTFVLNNAVPKVSIAQPQPTVIVAPGLVSPTPAAPASR